MFIEILANSGRIVSINPHYIVKVLYDKEVNSITFFHTDGSTTELTDVTANLKKNIFDRLHGVE